MRSRRGAAGASRRRATSSQIAPGAWLPAGQINAADGDAASSRSSASGRRRRRRRRSRSIRRSSHRASSRRRRRYAAAAAPAERLAAQPHPPSCRHCTSRRRDCRGAARHRAAAAAAAALAHGGAARGGRRAARPRATVPRPRRPLCTHWRRRVGCHGLQRCRCPPSPRGSRLRGGSRRRPPADRPRAGASLSMAPSAQGRSGCLRWLHAAAAGAAAAAAAAVAADAAADAAAAAAAAAGGCLRQRRRGLLCRYQVRHRSPEHDAPPADQMPLGPTSITAAAASAPPPLPHCRCGGGRAPPTYQRQRAPPYSPPTRWRTQRDGGCDEITPTVRCIISIERCGAPGLA